MTANHSIRRLSAATLLFAAVLMGACAATDQQRPLEPTRRTVDDVLAPGETSLIAGTPDPLEGFNRWIYNFNAHLDRLVFLPVVTEYKKYVPEPARRGLHNFLRNMREVMNIGNALLQLRLATADRAGRRFLVNSTIGIGGIFDPATDMGLYYQKEDFGQTLAVWGFEPGPYIVLPLLGPTNLRDTIGYAGDTAAWTVLNAQLLDAIGLPDWTSAVMFGVGTLDSRANIDFRYYETGTIYEYMWVRQIQKELRQFAVDK